MVARRIIACNASLFKVLMKESQIENDEEMVSIYWFMHHYITRGNLPVIALSPKDRVANIYQIDHSFFFSRLNHFVSDLLDITLLNCIKAMSSFLCYRLYHLDGQTMTRLALLSYRWSRSWVRSLSKFSHTIVFLFVNIRSLFIINFFFVRMTFH